LEWGLPVFTEDRLAKIELDHRRLKVSSRDPAFPPWTGSTRLFERNIDVLSVSMCGLRVDLGSVYEISCIRSLGPV
jgi:hypothetical protein